MAQAFAAALRSVNVTIMSDFGSPVIRRARPRRRPAVRAALIGVILFSGAAAWVWFSGYAAQPGPGTAATSNGAMGSVVQDRTTPSSTGNAATSGVLGNTAAAPTGSQSAATAPPNLQDHAAVTTAQTAVGRPATKDPASQDAAPLRPSFDIARITSTGDAVLAGRAAPNARVTISAGGKTISEVQADATGQWVALPVAALPPGANELQLAAQAPDSLAPVTASDSLLVVVPQPAAKAAPQPAVELSPPTTLALLLPPDGPPRLLQRPAAETATPALSGKPLAQTLNLDQVDYAAGGAIRFAGTAHPGASVRLYVDEMPVGDTVADSAGRWALEPAAAIAAGPHRIRVDEIGIRGQVRARVALRFDRAVIAPEDVLVGRVVVQPRQTLWRIARHAYGHGVQYTVIYQANREQITDPNRIFPGQIFAVPGPTSLAK